MCNFILNIMSRTSYMSVRWWWWIPLCWNILQSIAAGCFILSEFCCGCTLKQQSAGRHIDTLFWFLTNQSLFRLLNVACLAEKQQLSSLYVIGLTQPGLEPTIYSTRDEHVNHNTTDAIYNIMTSYSTTQISHIYTTAFRAKRLNNRTRIVRLFNRLSRKTVL